MTRLKSMSIWATACGLLMAAQSIAFPQSAPLRITGVDEPPELVGPPKKFTPPSDDFRQFFEIFPKDEKDAVEVRASIEALTKLLQQHPDYSDGYLMRAMFNRCMLNASDPDAAVKDINTAISTHAAQRFPGAYKSLADHYSLRAKIEFDGGRFHEALEDLEAAMKQKIDNADKIFNSGGTKPDRSSPNPCTWSLADLDSLAAKFPKDYRTALLRGSYLNFFTTIDEKYYADALREYQKAALLNPQSPLPHYFIGHLYTRASFWTKAAWASDEGRDEPQRKAILAYDKAIQLDPRFLPAYELRASAYHNLKQYRQAIRDYDKVLELDPENITAYADRGLAKMEVGQFLSATVDLGDAIRREKADDHSLTYSHEHRGDAYASLGMYRNAIADYSQALKDQLANLTFLLNLKQIRGLYPEYDGVPDDTMVRKINALFWPEYDHSVMAKQLLEGEGKWPITLVNDLYEKRGDAYLKGGDFRRGVLDFNRIFHGIPNFADTVERWRSLGSGKENWYLDVKSVEFGSTSRLWIKTARKDKTYTIAAYEIDCKGRRLNSSSSATYDQQDQLVNSSEASSGWLRIIPETIGETLYNGACSTAGSSR